MLFLLFGSAQAKTALCAIANLSGQDTSQSALHNKSNFHCQLKVSMVILKAEESHTWWEITEGCSVLKATNFFTIRILYQLYPQIPTTTSQRTECYLNCWEDFLVLTSSSTYLPNICLKVFAGSPISGSRAAVGRWLPSLGACSQLPALWEGRAVTGGRLVEGQI